MSEQQTLLDVRHLSVSFDSYDSRLEKVTFTAISDLSVSLHRGEILAVVGSSGSGKSLLAHAVLHILPQNARVGGEMFYDGHPLTAEAAERTTSAYASRPAIGTP